jgi:RNA polymerase sigma-70 factor (ECF subfamily)
MPASATAPTAWPSVRSSAPPSPARVQRPATPAVSAEQDSGAVGNPKPRPSGVRLRLVQDDLSFADSTTAMAGQSTQGRDAGDAASVATMSHGGARPITLRPVNDTGSRGSSGPVAIGLAAADIDVLVARAQRNDRGAFTELFRRHRADVARLVYRMMGPSADMEDIVQEVFLQVHRSIGEFRGQAKFSTWLHRVTVNVVLMARRAARSRPVLTGETPTEYEPDAGLPPDEDAMRRRRIEAFRRLLDRLPEKKRIVFELHELDGWSPADIAEHVKAPVLTVRTRLFYARREIAAMIREEPALAQLADDLDTQEPDAASPVDDAASGRAGVPQAEARGSGAKPGKAGVEEAT